MIKNSWIYPNNDDDDDDNDNSNDNISLDQGYLHIWGFAYVVLQRGFIFVISRIFKKRFFVSKITNFPGVNLLIQ